MKRDESETNMNDAQVRATRRVNETFSRRSKNMGVVWKDGYVVPPGKEWEHNKLAEDYGTAFNKALEDNR